MTLRISTSLLIVLVLLAGCASPEDETANEAALQPGQDDKLSIQTIEAIIGIEGTEQDGEYKVTVPQNDLDVTVEGFKIIPPMGMGSWAAFTPTTEGAMVMGDIIVQEDEIGPVQKVVIDHGLTVSGLHNHFVREQPNVMYMHIGGVGSEEELARGVRAIFDKVIELRGGAPSKAKAQTVENTLDTERITQILGHSGTMNRGAEYRMGRVSRHRSTCRAERSTLIMKGDRVNPHLIWMGRGGYPPGLSKTGFD